MSLYWRNCTDFSIYRALGTTSPDVSIRTTEKKRMRAAAKRKRYLWDLAQNRQSHIRPTRDLTCDHMGSELGYHSAVQTWSCIRHRHWAVLNVISQSTWYGFRAHTKPAHISFWQGGNTHSLVWPSETPAGSYRQDKCMGHTPKQQSEFVAEEILALFSSVLSIQSEKP